MYYHLRSLDLRNKTYSNFLLEMPAKMSHLLVSRKIKGILITTWYFSFCFCERHNCVLVSCIYLFLFMVHYSRRHTFMCFSPVISREPFQNCKQICTTTTFLESSTLLSDSIPTMTFCKICNILEQT